MGTSLDERKRMLALLQANHTFPGPYTIRVVLEQGKEDSLVEAVHATSATVVEVSNKPSRTGKWESVRLVLEVRSAEEVLTVYEAVSAVEGVVTSL